MTQSTCVKAISSRNHLRVWVRAIALTIAPLALISVWGNPSSAEELQPDLIELPTPTLEESPVPSPEESPSPTPLEPTPVVSPTPTGPLEPQPVPLSILNPSFEEDIVGGDGAVDYITGWQILSSSFWSVGTYRPGSGLYASQVPDGVNVAYANSGSLFQRLTDSLTANTQYTLGFNVGSRPPYGFPGYQVDLLAGETVIATTNSPVPEFGQFIFSELSYTASEVDPLLGQPLAIRLSSSGIQVNFDNIRLTALLLTPAVENPTAENPAVENPAVENPGVVAMTTIDETVDDTSVPLAIAPEGDNPPETIDESAPESLVEAPQESDWVFAARMLPAISRAPALAATAKSDREDDVQSVPEPTTVIGLLLSAASLTRLKQNTSSRKTG